VEKGWKKKEPGVEKKEEEQPQVRSRGQNEEKIAKKSE
jgi:hypothetical protein